MRKSLGGEEILPREARARHVIKPELCRRAANDRWRHVPARWHLRAPANAACASKSRRYLGLECAHLLSRVVPELFIPLAQRWEEEANHEA